MFQFLKSISLNPLVRIERELQGSLSIIIYVKTEISYASNSNISVLLQFVNLFFKI